MFFSLKERFIQWKKKISSFTFLNITQFLGAMNDNLYKLLMIYFFIEMEGIEKSHVILSTAGAIYVFPFLLFSSSAGIMADRFSKRNIIIVTKVLEFLIMILGLLSFNYSSKFMAYGTLFLLASHSTLFSPSKYGILPELLPQEKISKANGIMTSFTYLAMILGTFFASFLLDFAGRNYILASGVCIAIAFLGILVSSCIEYTPPAGSRKQLNLLFINDIYETLKRAKPEPSLLAAILGSSFFLFLAAYVQLNIIPFAVQSLGLSDVQGGYLFILTAIGIGTGSLLAGKISGKLVELGIVPIAAFAISICFYLLGIYPSNLISSIILVVLIGLFGGIYLLPLDAYLQIVSPKKYLGQTVAACTFLSFIGVLGASIMIYVVTEVFGQTAEMGFIILSCLTLINAIIYTFLFFDYLTRFIGMLLSRLHFKINFIGQDKISDLPSVYICCHTAWNDTLLMLGAQRRRMRFFIQNEQDHSSKWLNRMYKALRVIFIPEIESLENNVQCLNEIKRALNKGISVCIFVENEHLETEFNKLKKSEVIQQILREREFSLISVQIEKGEKDKVYPFFTRLLNKFRVPATMIFNTVSWEKDENFLLKSDPSSSLLEERPPFFTMENEECQTV